eukprot:TRINITY_DN22085_c0_g1_i1.p1 TRINITY_DN22085_c0_g1~~TRINITY_DN22085_c0_g1_i1.p1  ORF type:complete len:576 (-),score=116.36 TRINITY_DN22085_c0_g1_i1:30-1529(-)
MSVPAADEFHCASLNYKSGTAEGEAESQRCNEKNRFICELPESEWDDWSSYSWSTCDQPCGLGSQFKERNCRVIQGKNTCPNSETERRAYRSCTLGPCKECCSKIYVTASGIALKTQYGAFGDYFEISGTCDELKGIEGCNTEECQCNGRSVWIQKEHASGKQIMDRNYYLYFFTGEGRGKWAIAQSINAKNYILVKKSAQACPHTDDEIRWQYRSSKGHLENDDQSLDVGCVGECILSNTNDHAIGEELKLKDGAETESARFQFQMGKIGLSVKSIIMQTQVLRNAMFEGDFSPYRSGNMDNIESCRAICQEKSNCVAFQWFNVDTSKSQKDNCKLFRMIDLKPSKLTDFTLNGISRDPDYRIEILGMRETDQDSLTEKCARGFLPYGENCIGIERVIEVSKEEAITACNSVKQGIRLAALTTDDVNFVRKEIEADTIGNQRFFISNVTSESWNSENDILLIKENGIYDGENSSNQILEKPHFFICKYPWKTGKLSIE